MQHVRISIKYQQHCSLSIPMIIHNHGQTIFLHSKGLSPEMLQIWIRNHSPLLKHQKSLSKTAAQCNTSSYGKFWLKQHTDTKSVVISYDYKNCNLHLQRCQMASNLQSEICKLRYGSCKGIQIISNETVTSVSVSNLVYPKYWNQMYKHLIHSCNFHITYVVTSFRFN